MAEEVWKVCEDYPRLEVSNFGGLRHTKSKEPKYKRVHKSGYIYTQIKIDGKAKSLKVHRLVCQAFLENPEKKPFVNHKNLDKSDNRIENLEWVSVLENNRHAIENNAVPVMQGSLNGRAKLNESLVHQVCKKFQDGLQPKEVVELFGISRQQATKIKAGFAWKHISSLYDIPVNKRNKNFND